MTNFYTDNLNYELTPAPLPAAKDIGFVTAFIRNTRGFCTTFDAVLDVTGSPSEEGDGGPCSHHISDTTH